MWPNFEKPLIPFTPRNADAHKNAVQNFKHIFPLTFCALQLLLVYNQFPVSHYTWINFMFFIALGYQRSRQEVCFDIWGLDPIKDMGTWK